MTVLKICCVMCQNKMLSYNISLLIMYMLCFLWSYMYNSLNHIHFSNLLLIYYNESLLTFILLLCISYKFVKGVLALTFLLLVFSSWNFHDVCQRFLYNQEQNFSLIRQKTKIFPIVPIIRIAHFCNVMSILWRYKSGRFL